MLEDARYSWAPPWGVPLLQKLGGCALVHTAPITSTIIVCNSRAGMDANARPTANTGDLPTH